MISISGYLCLLAPASDRYPCIKRSLAHWMTVSFNANTHTCWKQRLWCYSKSVGVDDVVILSRHFFSLLWTFSLSYYCLSFKQGTGCCLALKKRSYKCLLHVKQDVQERLLASSMTCFKPLWIMWLDMDTSANCVYGIFLYRYGWWNKRLYV